jgi:lipopolysaccharide transport protein LptA
MARWRTYDCRRDGVVGLMLCLAMAAGLVHGQKLGSGKGIKFADYYEAPHETQMKWLLEGASAVPLAGGRGFLVTEPKVQTYRDNGEGEMIVEAPQCTYDADQRTVSSPGLLRLRTADGTFNLEGEGFSWLQAGSILFVSNRVHTIVHPELVGLQSANARTNTAARPAAPIDIFSDQFDYAEKSGEGIYRGNVRVVGTNLAVTGGILTVLVPRTDRRLQSLTAETNVILDYGNIHATGERATYSVDTERVHLTGHPTWRHDQQEGRGDELVLDRTNGVFRADGHAWLKMPGHALGTLGFLPPTASPSLKPAPETNVFVEIQSEAYELRTNSAVFSDAVRVTERRDDQLQGKMTCSRLAFTFAGTNALQRMVAEKQVVVEQETNRLSCGLLTLTFAGTNELQRMVAQQEVVIAQETNRFTAGEAVYTATNGMLELKESPTWQAGLREGKGDLILVDVPRHEMAVQTNAFMRLPAKEFGRSVAFGANTSPLAQPKTGPDQFAQIFSHDYKVGPEGALFRGNVRLDHPRMQWTCGQVTALAPPGAGRISRLVAEQAVAFAITDDKGQQTHGTGDKAVYTYGVSGTVTNETMVLTGTPALLTATNFMGRNNVFILDLAKHRLGAPGKSKYVVRDLVKAGSTNVARMPERTIIE